VQVPPLDPPPQIGATLSLTAGPDGNLWFTEYGADRIGRITPAGAITQFGIHDGASLPYDITTGADGNLWFTEYEGKRIGQITPDGAIRTFAIPAMDSLPYGIAPRPDGNLWFAESGADKIGRITDRPAPAPVSTSTMCLHACEIGWPPR
jgi:virginiamycin B lyase